MFYSTSDCRTDRCFYLVTRQHPNTYSSISQIFYCLYNIILKLILNTRDTEHLHIILLRSVSQNQRPQSFPCKIFTFFINKCTVTFLHTFSHNRVCPFIKNNLSSFNFNHNSHSSCFTGKWNNSNNFHFQQSFLLYFNKHFF